MFFFESSRTRNLRERADYELKVRFFLDRGGRGGVLNGCVALPNASGCAKVELERPSKIPEAGEFSLNVFDQALRMVSFWLAFGARQRQFFWGT